MVVVVEDYLSSYSASEGFDFAGSWLDGRKSVGGQGGERRGSTRRGAGG